MNIEVITLDEKSKKFYAKQIQELENLADYPFGDEFFKINHGTNYFSFFDRLGDMTFRVALHQNKVVACAAGIVRTLLLNGKTIKAWYLCDLKVHPDYLGQKIPSKIFKKNLITNYLKCGRAYAISMNPRIGENRVVRLLKKFSWLPFNLSTKINFYNLPYQELLQFIENNNLDSQCFLSLSGIKDLILNSTGKPIKLLHFQSRQLIDTVYIGPTPDHIHMYCAIVGSNLDNLLSKRFKPAASASVISHRMNNFNWDFISSSDI